MSMRRLGFRNRIWDILGWKPVRTTNRSNDICNIKLYRRYGVPSLIYRLSMYASCEGPGCNKWCLVPRIVQHIEEEGSLPPLVSPCRHIPGACYWSWSNRYHGDLVSVDLDALEYPHTRTKWKVSNFRLWCISPRHSQSTEPGRQYTPGHCCPSCGMARLRKRPYQHGARPAIVVLSGSD